MATELEAANTRVADAERRVAEQKALLANLGPHDELRSAAAALLAELEEFVVAEKKYRQRVIHDGKLAGG